MNPTVSILKKQMHAHKIDALLLCANDTYFNEYVPKKYNSRALITGFSGSAGDALLFSDKDFLFVDGRYTQQAKMQAPTFTVFTTTLGTTIESAWLSFIRDQAFCTSLRLAFDPHKISVQLLAELTKRCAPKNIELVPIGHTLVAEALKEQDLYFAPSFKKISPVDIKYCGTSTRQKLKDVFNQDASADMDAYLAISLDEIAWISNFRGDDFENQTTFAARALIFPDVAHIFLANQNLPSNSNECIKWHREDELGVFLNKLDNNKTISIAFDPNLTPQSLFQELSKHEKIQFKPLKSPMAFCKSIKNEAELLCMRKAFAFADQAVNSTLNWIRERVIKGDRISEQDAYDKIIANFYANGAVKLSFNPITAAGKNGSIIHYGTPDSKRILQHGEIFLLDCGAYYEGGFATDLTRTIFLGNESDKPSKEQTHFFSSVLVAALNGMMARIPKGTTGAALDAITRSSLWLQGLNFAHGTGHGVGINVHERPPTISTAFHQALQKHQVFSIEPGYYHSDFGGILIENLCTLVNDPQHSDYLRVLPLTFCPYDTKLIDFGYLNKQQKRFFDYLQGGFLFDAGSLPPLFELDS